MQGKKQKKSMMLETLKICLSDNMYGYMIIATILASIVVIKKTEIELRILKNVVQLAKTRDDMLSCIFNILCIEIFCSFLQEFKKFLFASTFGKQIEKISLKAFKNVFAAANLSNFDKENGITQNEIRVGSEGMASLLSAIVLNIFPQLIGVMFLMLKFSDEFGTMFSIFVFVAFAVCAVLHYYTILLKIKYQQTMLNFQGMSQKTLYEALTNFEVIKTCGTEEIEEKKYSQKMNKYQKNVVYYRKTGYILTVLHRAIFSSLTFTVYCYYVKTSFDMGEANKKILVLKTLLDLSETNATRTASIYVKMKKHILNATFIQKYLVKRKSNEVNMHVPDFFKHITLTNVTVEYELTYILNNINVRIQKGDKIAIVGPNGAGKSTFLKLLVKLNDYEGLIELDGWDIDDIENESLRQLIAYVPQNVTLFNETIYYNLTYGTDVEENEIKELCDMLDLTDSVMKQPDGFNTNIGENGVKLSGGMKKKILICRALLKKSEILLLDEAAANLDNKTTKNLLEHIFSNPKMTVLMVAHQKDVIMKFDKFLYCNNSEVEVIHSHNDLFQKYII